mmetsp:Transcript_38084/g.80186  ORF Transcript_38084/g.80186 Transcript_38084/m.80186 type:complete len:97 (-) Transcript_38084:985-1275(-)
MASANNNNIIEDHLEIDLAQGSLGVTIRESVVDGSCIIMSKTNDASPLELGDIIVSINGIKLKNVKGGSQAWVSLILSLAYTSRKLVVYRPNVAEA